jgi:hypothetical protein
MRPLALRGLVPEFPAGVSTPIVVPALARLLSLHPDRALVDFLLEGFTFGFSLGVHGVVSQGCRPNLRSTQDDPGSVSRALSQEISRGHSHGPFPAPPFDPFHASPLGIVSKKGGSHRLILDLSDHHDGSVNAGISPEEFAVSYCSFDDAVSLVLDAGPTPFMAKVDIKHAFRLCPVRPSDWPLLCFHWLGSYFFDSRLPFGLRSSPFIFNSFADALHWILSSVLSLRRVIHYLDDFFLCHSSLPACAADMRRLISLFDHLGVPLAPAKVCGPARTLTFLGIEIDSVLRVARLPADKFAALLSLLAAWRDRRRCSKRDLLSLIGHLSFAAKVVKPGRLFLRRLIDLSTTVPGLHHRIRLSADSREDILWWLSFLPTWNGVSILQAPPVSSADLHLFTDASALGIGGVFGRRWFSLPLTAFRRIAWFPTSSPFDINFWELLALLVAFFTWSALFRDRQVYIHTDNLPLVYMWSRGARSSLIMRLLRALFLRTARCNANLLLLHIPGHDNVLADFLSRLQVPQFFRHHPTADPSPSPTPPDVWLL